MKITLTRDSIIGPMKGKDLNCAKAGSVLDLEDHVAEELIRLGSATPGESKGGK